MLSPKTFRYLPLACLLFSLAALAAHPNPFLGKWYGSSRGDQWQEFTLVIQPPTQASAGHLSGDILLDDGTDLPLSHIHIEGRHIVMQLSSPDGDTYTISGTLRHGQLSGKYHSDNSAGTWKATRTKPTQ